MVHAIHIRKIVAFLLILTTLFAALLTMNVRAADVTSAAGRVATSYGALNVRNLASISGSIVSKLPSGSTVTLLGKIGNWWRVEYAASRYGYVSADYIRYVYGTYTVTISSVAGAADVRSGPATNYTASGTVPSGRTVIVLKESGGWLKILYNGAQTGYVRLQDVKSLMSWPVPASYKINQYFGGHNGIDIGSAIHGVAGDAVIAAQLGKVVYAGWLNGYGYVVYINSVYNGQPIQTRYAHLTGAYLPAVGTIVGIGQRIGSMGSTGTSTGVHLHFEVRVRNSFADCLANVDSTPVNPIDYLNLK